jgi:hypothetical protein
MYMLMLRHYRIESDANEIHFHKIDFKVFFTFLY